MLIVLRAGWCVCVLFPHRTLQFQYSIVGHSGSASGLPLVEFGKPPSTDADKYEVVQKIYAHANGCASGDNSMQAADQAIQALVTEDADDYFLFLLSDANLGRYDVSPQVSGESKESSMLPSVPSVLEYTGAVLEYRYSILLAFFRAVLV